LAEQLFEAGFGTRSARSGEEAIEAINGFVPDIALISLAMPGMNGFELARQLELDPALCKCRMVAMTTHDCPEYREGAKAVAFAGILKKPLEAASLAPTIVEMCEAPR
jgi:hypothetical protein